MNRVILIMVLFVSIIFAEKKYRESTHIKDLSKEIIKIKLEELKKNRTTLPARVNHLNSKYLRPVFSQKGGSCGSASRISYMLAYELNNYRDLSGADSANMLPSHFTWLLTGQNSAKDEMAIFNGVPNILTYGGPLFSYELGGNCSWPTDDDNQEYGWMQGYDKWRSALNNRLEKTEKVRFTDYSDIEYIKWWLYNHHDDSSFN